MFAAQETGLVTSFKDALHIQKYHLKQFVSAILIAGMLSISTPAAPQIIAQTHVRPKQQNALFSAFTGWYEALTSKISNTFLSDPPATQETQEFRDSEVVGIEVSFPSVVGVGYPIQLEGVPYDANGTPVSGVRLEWSIDTPSGEHITEPGQSFVLDQLGQYAVTVTGAGKDNISSISTTEPVLSGSLSDDSAKSLEQQNNLLPFEEWNPTNIEHAQIPVNLRGSTPGIPKRNSNFNINAPVLSIAGRAGLDVNLELSYNSRVWAKMGQEVSFDMDRDLPAPGWSIGYGKIIHFLTDPNPANRKMIQIDGSGTRRFFSGAVKNESNSRTFEGQSTDGSFVKASTVSHGAIVSGQECYNSNTSSSLKYPDGSTVWYAASDVPYAGCVPAGTPITLYPTTIVDKHGNYISIVYHSLTSQDGRIIDYIKDTLGRVYKFNYVQIDSSYYLSNITGPGLRDSNGVVTQRTFIRLNYKNHTLAYNFSSLTPKVRNNNNNIKVLSSIYYPSTNTGYWFGDPDSYSPYGMVRKIEEHRGMTYDSETGVIGAGLVNRQRVYSYPENTSAPIGDVPEYPNVVETWDGMPHPNSPLTTQYVIDWTSPTRTTTVISPGQQGKTIEYSHNSPGTPLDGITFKTEYFDGNNVLLSRDVVDWATASLTFSAHNNTATYNLSSLRPTAITHTEFSGGAALTKQTINDVFGPYNRVLQMREIGYNGEVLRKAATTYTDINDSLVNYSINQPRIINLPTQVEVFDGNNNRLDHTEYRYDVANVHRVLPPPTNFIGNACPSQGTCPSAGMMVRGNLSNVIKYEVVTNNDLQGQVNDGRIYSAVGNIILYNPSYLGVNATYINYIAATSYAYPEGVGRGLNWANGLIRSSATYDINTGLTLSTTDVSQRPSVMEYDIENWRLKRVTASTGAFTTSDYNDAARTYATSTFDSGGTLVQKNISKINGLGLVVRSESLSASGISGNDLWDVIETEYDNLGRLRRRSNPFHSSETPSGLYWSEVFYDSAGRVERTVAPDGSQKFNYYGDAVRPQGASTDAGHTFRVKDPIGREKWHRTDADGNVVEVVEPAPFGNGSVSTGGLITKYNYDLLGRLIRTEQDSQERKFKYDGIGRLTHQKMAETKPTLNDAGVYVGEGTGTWSDHFIYNQMSLVSSATDARGVTTDYSYFNPAFHWLPMDPMARLMSVSYSTNGASDVLPASTVKFEYEPAGDFTRVKSVYTETNAGVNPERVVTYDFGYDIEGRLQQKKTRIASRNDHPMAIDYSYDSLSRVTDVTYPEQYEGTGSPYRKTLNSEFDSVGRIGSLKVDGVKYASDFVFNSFDQATSLKIGPSGANQITREYNYNPQSGLLENQKVLKGTNSLLDLSYEYQQCSCSTGGSGQITKIVSNLDRNKDRTYEYDALARLLKVTGGVNETWSQSYGYDRFGNRLSVSSLGFEALAQLDADQANMKTDTGKGLFSVESPLGMNRTSKEIQPVNSPSAVRRQIETPTPKIVRTGKLDIPWLNTLESDKKATAGKNDDSLENEESGNTGPSETGVAFTTAGTPFDFDGDGKADFGTWRRTNGTLAAGTWMIRNSQTGQTGSSQLGASGDHIAPGDYDGDGKYDRAVWNPATGVWTIVLSSTGNTVTQQWGETGDAIVPADYDGDGKTDIAIWRGATGDWWILKSSDSSFYVLNFGRQSLGDIPAVGDYDGDGLADVTVWRPSDGDWYALIIQSSSGYVAQAHFGMAGDVPVPADYDGDGKTDLAVWRPSNSVWYIYQTSNSQVMYHVLGSESGRDVLVPADYDGDGKADPSVWTPSTGIWTVRQSSSGTATTHTLGTKDDVAIPSAYIRRSSAPRGQSVEVPRDGHEALSFDPLSNRITTPGFEYDAAGNQTRIVKPDGTVLRFQYDAAGRMVKVKNDGQQTIVTYTYGVGRERLITQEGDETSTNLTYYAWEGGSVIAEYIEGAGNTLLWVKDYVYLGGSLLATHDKTTNGEHRQFHHPDQLGTRLVTDPATGTHFEQATLPFGTALDSESTGATNRRFTSYDRSASTGLDYATNRFYDSSQGRFTTVDPIKMSAASLLNPQTLNMYAYTANDPINKTDPSGLFPTIGGNDNSHVFINTTGIGGFPTGGTGTSIFGGISAILTGLLGNLFNGGRSYAGSFGTPTYFWQLNTAQITLSQPPPLPGAGTISSVTTSDADYSTADCLNGVVSFMQQYATGEGGSLSANAATYIGPLLSYLQGWSASVTETAFALANSYHETQLFSKWVEPVSKLSKGYDGGDDYRGRGYIHLTGKGTYRDVMMHMSRNSEKFGLSAIPQLTVIPDAAANIQFALQIQTAYFDLKGTFGALSSGNYLKARQTINPGESINNKIGPKPRKGKDNRPTIKQRITGLTSGLESILKGC